MPSFTLSPNPGFGPLSLALRRQAPLFVTAAILIGCVLAGMFALDAYLRDALIRQGEHGARNLSYLVADQTDRSLEAADATVSKIVALMRARSLTSIADMKSAAAAPDIQAAARDWVSTNALLDSVFMVAADGKLAGANSEIATSIAALHGQDNLKSLRFAAADAVHVTSPFESASRGTWLLSLSKRVATNEGQFLGVVGVVVKLGPLEELAGKVPLGDHESFSIFREDGVLISCFPQRELAVASDNAIGDVRELIRNRQDGVTGQTGADDGVARMFAVYHSTKFPVVSVVAAPMSEVLAAWPRESSLLTAGACLLVCAIVFGTVLLAVRAEQLSQARQREEVQAQVAVEYKRFNDAMDSIAQGLAMYDSDNTLIACNKRYAEIYGLPAAVTDAKFEPGNILATHDYRRSGETWGEPRKERDGGLVVEGRLADGRFIVQRKKQLPGGGWVSTHEDITARRRAEQRAEELATNDVLTGLANRSEFKRRLDQCLTEVRVSGGNYAIHFLDLADFKAVNDSLGHTVGDELLREVATRLTALSRQGDTIARLGADEFAIIQQVSSLPRDAVQLAQRVIETVSQPYEIDGRMIELRTSVGVTVAPEDGLDRDELMRNADMALHHSKQERGGCKFFKPSMNAEVRARREMEDDMRVAIVEQQFELHFQPVVSVADRAVKSFEALLRWRRPRHGLVAPGDFIPLAEETGLIVPIGEWVIREACRQAAKWPSDIRVAVNMSVVQFKFPGLTKTVSEALASAGIDGSRLIVELTESVLIKDADQAIAMLHKFRQMGVKIAMDDFGTGYSSLSYLRRFPFDKIKIDRTFIGELGEREESAAIVRAAISLANALGMQTVAEGIETEPQMAHVQAEGCSEAQGFLISPPMRARDVFAYLGIDPIATPDPKPAAEPANPPVRLPVRIARFPTRRRDGTLTETGAPIPRFARQ
jgi:diguanylate cyclase (GGDEF)-like protein